MRLGWLAVVLLGCDPIATITVRFPVQSGPAQVTAYWVETYQGRTYPGMQIFATTVTDGEAAHTSQECCGTAAAYKAGRLAFVACVQTPAADPVLVCGEVRPGAAPPVRATVHATTCDELVRTFGHSDIDVRTCSLSPAHVGSR